MPPRNVEVSKPDLVREEFDIWKTHPITRAFLARLEALKGSYKEKWLEASWKLSLDKLRDDYDRYLLTDLRARDELVTSILNLDYKTIHKYMEKK